MTLTVEESNLPSVKAGEAVSLGNDGPDIRVYSVSKGTSGLPAPGALLVRIQFPRVQFHMDDERTSIEIRGVATDGWSSGNLKEVTLYFH